MVMVEVCFRCKRTEEEVRIFDGVNLGESVSVCGRCSIIDRILIIKKPSIGQLKSSESSEVMYNRLKKMAGIKIEQPKQKSISEEIKELEEHPELEKPDYVPLRLVDNFYWIIQHERRKKGLTHKQVADTLHESETAIKLIERNNLPENYLPLIQKLEQFFRVKLIRISAEKKSASFVQPQFEISRVAPTLVDTQKSEQIPKLPAFKKERAERVTIADLKRMQQRVEEDFPKKSREEIGREQLEEFGKSKDGREPAFGSSQGNRQPSQRVSTNIEKVPSIHELMDKKLERDRDKERLLGDEIEPLE